VTGQEGLAPGVIKVRMSGALPDMEVLTAILRQHGAIEVLGASSPYPNRRDPGVRVYLTVCASFPMPTPPAWECISGERPRRPQPERADPGEGCGGS